MSELSVFTPGKLYIAGEYSVVARATRAWLMPTSRGITARVQDSHTFRIISDGFDIAYDVSLNALSAQPLIKETLRTAHALIENKNIRVRPTTIVLTSTLTHNRRSLGLGSSGAVVAGILRALTRFHAIDMDAVTLFKAAVYVQRNALGRSSFGDVAQAVSPTPILYRPFDAFTAPLAFDDIFRYWEGLSIDPFEYPLVPLSVVNTGEKTSSQVLVSRVESCAHTDAYAAFLTTAASTFDELVESQIHRNIKRFLQTISTLNTAFKTLQDALDIPLFTEGMGRIARWVDPSVSAMKFSGAGGGDNVLIFHYDTHVQRAFEATLDKHAPTPLLIL